MMTANTLLLLGAANASAGPQCIQQAHERGLSVWLTDTSENLEQMPDLVAAADQVSPLDNQDRAGCTAWASEQPWSTPHVLASTAQSTTGAPHVVEIGPTLPAVLDLQRWRTHKAAALRCLTPPPGRVRVIRDRERVLSDPQSLVGRLKLKADDTIYALRSSSDREALIVATGPTTEATLATVERLRAQVAVEVPA